MSNAALVSVTPISFFPQPVDPRLLELKRMVLDSVVSPNSKRNYAQALDALFLFAAGRPLTRALLMEWRATMEKQAPSTVNVRLSAVRKMVAETRRNGMLGAEAAAKLNDIPNIRQQGTRLGNWLTKEQARELLAVPDCKTLKGKRDHAILALLVGCGLRRRELVSLDVEDIQMRENRWVIIDLCGKGGRIRTVAVPLWVKQGINVWMTAAGIDEGRLFRSVKKGGKKIGEGLGDWAVWSVVQQSARRIGVERFGAHDLRRTCAKLCRKNGGDLEQIQFLLRHSSTRRRSATLARSRRSLSQSTTVSVIEGRRSEGYSRKVHWRLAVTGLHTRRKFRIARVSTLFPPALFRQPLSGRLGGAISIPQPGNPHRLLRRPLRHAPTDQRRE